MFASRPSSPLLAKQLTRGALIALLATAAACSKGAPEGQTVATVNGEDITQSELNLELANVPADQRAKVQGQALQGLIDRKLLVQDAEKQNLDKQPEFVLTERRARELLLAQRSVQNLIQSTKRTPTDSDVNSYLDKHPAVGSNRRVLLVDQLKFAPPKSAAEARAFAPVKTMDQLAQVLQSRGAAFERNQSKVDTALVPDELMTKLAATEGGEPLIVIQGGVAIANVIAGAEPAPGSSREAEAIAKQRLAADWTRNTLKDRQSNLRNGAKIEYAAAFKPKPGTPGAAGAAAAAK